MKPTVGRIVHFYSDAQKSNPSGNPSWDGRGHNGQGAGPYAAIVGQVFDGADYANLFVFDPFAGGLGHWEGSVSEWNGEDDKPARYWVWPPRE